MGFLHSSTSFTRLRILDEVNNTDPDMILNFLRSHAFKDIDNIAIERSFGWTSFEDILDTEFERTYMDKGGYFTFSLRLDTRRVPPAVLKKHIRIKLMEEEKQLLAQGKKYVSKDRRAEIKDMVKLDLMTRFLPIPAEFQVVCSLDKKIVYLASTQQKIVDMFTELFVATFDLHLEPLTPYSLALDILGEDSSKELDEIQASSFI